MNERIRQLAVEAGMNIVDDKFSTYGKFAEKFAELIVRECAQLAEDYDGAHYVGTVIKKHFGVIE